MGKLVVRSLLRGKEVWKVLMRHRYDMWTPRIGGKWLPTTRWPFVQGNRMLKIIRWLRNNETLGEVVYGREIKSESHVINFL